MKIFRLVNRKFGKTLSGIGAMNVGGRWNSIGVEVIYCAESRSLAFVESLVNSTPISLLLSTYYSIVVEVPDQIKAVEIHPGDLAKGWDSQERTMATKTLGDEWYYEKRSLLLKVPSAATTGEYNYLINPHHIDYKQITFNAEVFPFDARLIK